MEFRGFAHRKHSQSDAGMNLAFLTVDGIFGRIIFIANTLMTLLNKSDASPVVEDWTYVNLVFVERA